MEFAHKLVVKRAKLFNKLWRNFYEIFGDAQFNKNNDKFWL